MKRNKVMVVTTGRADYGLLYPLLKKLDKNNQFELQLIATGTHLSPLHGKTINLIEHLKLNKMILYFDQKIIDFENILIGN